MSNDSNNFNPDLAYQQILQKRKQELLAEQYAPKQQVQVNHYGGNNNRNPRFNPELDTKMTFDHR